MLDIAREDIVDSGSANDDVSGSFRLSSVHNTPLHPHYDLSSVERFRALWDCDARCAELIVWRALYAGNERDCRQP